MKTNIDYQKGKIVGIYDKHNKLIYITLTIMDIVHFLRRLYTLGYSHYLPN